MSIQLIEPCRAYLPSYIGAHDEMVAAGVTTYRFDDARRFDVLGKFAKLRAAKNLTPHQVGADYYWLVDADAMRFLGEISIRHHLTPPLQRIGGHVGYAIRPSEQNKGYGTRMLALALPMALKRGIRRILITCEEENIASARVMEKNGFTLENRVICMIGGESKQIRRYWKTIWEGHEPMRNIVLIGMPGCGKSTIGGILAKALAMDFVDSDQVIQQVEQAKLSELLDRFGDDGFRAIEDRVNANLQLENSVIATGGSVVYGENAMRHLKEIGTVIYLKLGYPTIEERLGDLHARGVTIKPGWTLLDLYNERTPLYEKWADVIVDCEGLRLREIVDAVRLQVTP